MKLVIAGSTGYIGSAILSRAQADPKITNIVNLSRRALPDLPANPKTELVVVEDLTNYPASALTAIQSADAAIWCVGSYTGDQHIDIDLPLAFLDAIAQGRKTHTQPFKYVHLGGAFTEKPPSAGEEARTLWFMTKGRTTRGEAEARVKEYDGRDGMEVFVVRPAAVLPLNYGWVGSLIMSEALTVKIDEVAATMVKIAVEGCEVKVVENALTRKIGRKVLDG